MHGLAYALKGLGDAARSAGDHKRARETYGRARDLYQQIGFRNRYADVLRGLGDVARAQGDAEQADARYQQAYDICEQIGYRSGQADALRVLGDLAESPERAGITICGPGIAPFTDLVIKGDDQRALRRRPAGVLDRRQRRLPPGWTAARLSVAFPNAVMIRTPVHASWLNQIEIYFSVIHRKLLTPDNHASLEALAEQLTAFEARYTKPRSPSTGDSAATTSTNYSTASPPKPPRRDR